MKKKLQFFKNIFLTLALMLTIFATAFAQSSGTYTMINGEDYTLNITLTGDVIYNVPMGSATISGFITGGYKVTKTGPGNLYLTNNNNYNSAAGTVVAEGCLILGGNPLTGTTAGSITSNVEVKAGALLSFCRSNSVTFTNVITGEGGIEKAICNGTITLDAPCTYKGRTDIYGAGAFVLGTNGTIEQSEGVYLTQNNSVFNINSWKRIKRLNTGTGITGAKVNISAAGTLCVGSMYGADGGGTFAGTITGDGNFHKDGSEVLKLTGTNNYKGETGIYWGTIEFSANSLGAVTSEIYIRGAQPCTLRWATGNTQDISARIKGNTGSSVVFDTNGNIVTFASKLPDFTAPITKAGEGNLVIGTTTNTFTAPIAVTGGTLQIGSYTNATYAGKINSNVTVSAGAMLAFVLHTDCMYQHVISGDGTLVCYTPSSAAPEKKLILTGNNNIKKTNVEGYSILQIGSNTNSGHTGGDIELKTPNCKLIFYRANPYEFNEVISGSGKSVEKTNTNKVTLTKTCTYTAETIVTEGTLQLGDGTKTGNLTATPKVLLSTGTTLRFEPGDNLEFKQPITGPGKVEYNGEVESKELWFTAENTYDGNTTIEAGSLAIGNYTTTGAIKGDIINNGYLDFRRSNAYTYKGVISGGGMVYVNYSNSGGTITFEKAQQYTGPTCIYKGSLVLATNGTIANSAFVELFHDEAKLNIAAGDKTIQWLLGDGEVELGSKNLTIAEGGEFKGKISGTTGGIIKKGTGKLSLLGNNVATGLLSLEAGSLRFHNWNGNVKQAAGTELLVEDGAVSIGGTLTLEGGGITMDLTTTPPAKITASGAFSANGTTTLHITSGSVTNRELINAHSGIDDISKFSLSMPGFSVAELKATGTELLLTAVDTDPPVPGNSGKITCTPASTSATLKWTVASDNVSPANQLKYFVYRSDSNDLNSVTACATNGVLLNPGGTKNLTSFNATGLTPGATYYFNVVVADQTNNRAVYKAVAGNIPVGIASTTLSSQITVYPNPTTGQLKVETHNNASLQSVEIFDVFGRKVYEDNNSYGLTVLRSYDLTLFPAGVYFLKITTETGIVTKKIIKQ